MTPEKNKREKEKERKWESMIHTAKQMAMVVMVVKDTPFDFPFPIHLLIWNE